MVSKGQQPPLGCLKKKKMPLSFLAAREKREMDLTTQFSGHLNGLTCYFNSMVHNRSDSAPSPRACGNAWRHFWLSQPQDATVYSKTHRMVPTTENDPAPDVKQRQGQEAQEPFVGFVVARLQEHQAEFGPLPPSLRAAYLELGTDARRLLFLV